MYLFWSFNKLKHNSIRTKQGVQKLDACVALDGIRASRLWTLRICWELKTVEYLVRLVCSSWAFVHPSVSNHLKTDSHGYLFNIVTFKAHIPIV